MTNRLDERFFARRADNVAQDLLGRTLVVKVGEDTFVRARLREVAAYEGSTKRTSEGAKYHPGLVSISVKYGQCLVDIATGGGKKKDASCITLRAADFDIKGETVKVEGPRRVAKELGITSGTREGYECLPAYGRKIWIEGVPIKQKEIKKRCNATNK